MRVNNYYNSKYMSASFRVKEIKNIIFIVYDIIVLIESLISFFFWCLKEMLIESSSYSCDMRSIMTTTTKFLVEPIYTPCKAHNPF